MTHFANRLPVLSSTPRQSMESDQAVNFYEGVVQVPGVRKPVEYTLALPEEPSVDVIAIGVNGFAATKPSFNRFMGALARQHAIPTLHFDPARIVESRLNIRQALFNPQKPHQDTLEMIANDLQDNLTIARMPNGRMAKAARLAIVPHSMGDQSAVKFVRENPATVDSLVHLAGNGLEGASGTKLIRRTATVVAHDVIPSAMSGRDGYDRHNLARSIGYILSNPLQTVGEVVSCMTADLRQDVKAISEQGTYQSFVGFNHDNYFNPADSLREIGQFMDHWRILDGIHTGPQAQPDYTAEHVAEIIIDKPVTSFV